VHQKTKEEQKQYSKHMENHKKNILLQNCTTLEPSDIISIVKKGEITIEEFKAAGLSQNIIDQILSSITSKEQIENNAKRRREFLEKVISGRVSADEIKANINNGSFSFDDLLDAGISERVVNSLKHYCNSRRITLFRNINQLPPMEEGRTDVYFVGVPGSGKSTMLSGLLNMANKNGILMADIYNNDGSIYQTQLISDLNKGVLPNATASGSYNYVALSLKDGNGAKHPFNIVEVPGENYVNMFNNGDVGEFLSYISNGNKKILIFVIDAMAHHTGYNDSSSQLDQNLVYVNILNMFKANGILNQTDAIYLVANKFDALKETRYIASNSSDVDLADDFLQEEFKNLIANCKDAREESNNKFKIKVLPFSIGNVSYTSVIENFNKEHSEVVIENLIEDSFVVEGAKFNIYNLFNKRK
jgi:DNA replication protein DnaC